MSESPRSDSELFRAAIELPPEQRRAFLAEACATDPQLRSDVESLLRAHLPDDQFLHPPAPAATIGMRQIERPGSIIGRYKLREQIGEGGFGVVYVAEQEQPVRRKVALKVIKPGMDSRDVIARFEAERQALALMDHPNVARVFDAGTTESGRPFFVMELVQGVTITEFCDRNTLAMRERLALFADVCRAVQHAHQKGIIHRDLKPSNIMVTLHDGKPVVKVIDFGVSKALSQQLTEKTIYTAYGQMIGTPQYMSPEQAEMSGLGIDTRSDIFSLGVLLYELLTGQTPLDATRLRSSAYAEILRIIREEEPPRPSQRVSTLGEQATVIARQRDTDPQQLRRDLSGELDWIVLKCLEKDRSRRYETAVGLARDVERYLEDEPVEACPPSRMYRFKKFTRKHRTMLATAAAFAALLVVGGVLSSWLAVRERQASKVAEQERAAAVRSLREEQRQRDLASERAAEAQSAREQLRHALYAANMSLAQSAWESRQFNQLNYALERERPGPNQADYRGWEWHYWRRQLNQGRIPIGEALNSATAPTSRSDALLSCDGARFISSQHERLDQGGWIGAPEVNVQDSRTGAELVRFRPFPEATGPNKFGLVLPNHDGSRLAVYSECDRPRLAIFDGATGQLLQDIEVQSAPAIKYFHFDHAGARFVFSSASLDQQDAAGGAAAPFVDVIDVATGETIYRRESEPTEVPLVGAISPDGSKLLLSTYYADQGDHPQHWKLIEIPSGREIWKRDFAPCRLAIKCWSSDGGVIAVGLSTNDKSQGSLQLITTATGRSFAAYERPFKDFETGSWQDVAISPDSRQLARIGRSEIQLFQIPTLESIGGVELSYVASPDRSIPDPTASLIGLAFSSDGNDLVALSFERGVYAWRLSDLPTPTTSVVSKTKVPASRFRFSRQADRLAFPDASGDRIHIWDVASKRILATLDLDKETPDHTDSSYFDFNFSTDGNRLFSIQRIYSPYSAGKRTAPKQVGWLHDVRTGALLRKIEGQQQGALATDVHPSGDRIAILEQHDDNGKRVSTLSIQDVATGKTLKSIDVELASDPWPGQLTFVREGSELVIRSISFATDSPSDAASDSTAPLDRYDRISSTFLFFDSVSLAPLRSFTIARGSSVVDNRRETILNLTNGLASFHDLQTGRVVVSLHDIAGYPQSMWSPDGSRIALAIWGAEAGQSDEVTLWSASLGHKLLSLPLPGRPLAIHFSPDGHQLHVAHETSKGDGGLAITTWDATPSPAD